MSLNTLCAFIILFIIIIVNFAFSQSDDITIEFTYHSVANQYLDILVEPQSIAHISSDGQDEATSYVFTGQQYQSGITFRPSGTSKVTFKEFIIGRKNTEMIYYILGIDGKAIAVYKKDVNSESVTFYVRDADGNVIASYK